MIQSYYLVLVLIFDNGESHFYKKYAGTIEECNKAKYELMSNAHEKFGIIPNLETVHTICATAEDLGMQVTEM